MNDDEEEVENVEEDVAPSDSTSQQIYNIRLTEKLEEQYKIHYKHSDVIGVQALLRNYASVNSMLQNQIGTRSIATFRGIIKEINLSSLSQVRLNPSGGTIDLQIKSLSESNVKLPSNGISKERLTSLMERAFDLFDNKEIEKAVEVFTNVIKYAVFFISATSEDVSFVKKTISTCTEYLIMVRLLNAAEQLKSDKFGYSQMLLLVIICKLERSLHQFIMLKKAKISAKNTKNYLTTVILIQRMLKLSDELKEYEDLGFDKLLQEYNFIKDKGNEKDYPFNA